MISRGSASDLNLPHIALSSRFAVCVCSTVFVSDIGLLRCWRGRVAHANFVNHDALCSPHDSVLAPGGGAVFPLGLRFRCCTPLGAFAFTVWRGGRVRKKSGGGGPRLRRRCNPPPRGICDSRRTGRWVGRGVGRVRRAPRFPAAESAAWVVARGAGWQGWTLAYTDLPVKTCCRRDAGNSSRGENE